MARFWPFMNKNLLAEAAAPYQSSLKKHVSDGLVLYHEDALTVMRKILDKHPEGCFDMIFADPPYFLFKQRLYLPKRANGFRQ